MKKTGLFTLLLFIAAPVFAGVYYVFPPPGAAYVRPRASIIFKIRDAHAPQSVRLSGSLSGNIAGELRPIDRFTRQFIPQIPFVAGERVTVTLSGMLTWQFDVSPEPDLSFPYDWIPPAQTTSAEPAVQSAGRVTDINGVSVPGDFPDIQVRQYGETAPGRIFFGSTFLNVGNYIVIMENDGTPYFYRRYPANNRGSGEFKVQPAGILTFYLFRPQFFVGLDHNFAEIDTFRCKHGYTTDPHEMVMTKDGHVFLIGLDPQKVDMSQWVSGGQKSATVLGNHVQELNKNGEVVFEWRSWDHFNITDARHVNLRGTHIDYVHMNSIAVDYDGHLVISSRHLDEVTKIDHNTGDMIWRLGGENNQFEFINEPYEFSYQHFFRPVPGKPDHYTLFDNGNHRSPQFSRAVQYKLDPLEKTAEKVWEFRYQPDRYSNMMGNVQRLDNGNTFINWSNWPPLFACEVTPAGEVVYECRVSGVSSNRVRRYQWEGKMPAPYLIAEANHRGVILVFNKFGDPDVDYYNVYGGTSPNPVQLLAKTGQTFVVLSELENFADWYFRVTAVDRSGVESDYSNTEKIHVSMIEPGQNMVLNGDFSSGKKHWQFNTQNNADAKAVINADKQIHIQIFSGGDDLYDVQLEQPEVQLIQGSNYRFEFDARADATRRIEAKVVQNGAPFENYGRIGLSLLKKQDQHFIYDFTMEHPTDLDARIVFNCGIDEPDVYIDNISLKQQLDNRVKPAELPVKNCSLAQNYPNPFNSRTCIRFRVPEEGNVTLYIFNVQGQRVKTLVDGVKRAGQHEVTFDASGLTTGLYFYKLSAPSFSRVRKMLFVQ